MTIEERNKAYNDYVNKKIPKTKWYPALIHAFWTGGVACCLGQVISEGLRSIFPAMTTQIASTWMLIALIFIASFLTAIGVFDKIGALAGAGTMIPITGFSNSITSPAMEFSREGIIFGTCAKMFVVAGPVIVCGVASSILVGIIYLFI